MPVRARTHTHTPTHTNTHRNTLQVILYSVPCNVLHWTDNKIYHWKLEGSTVGENYTTLLTPSNPTYLVNTVKNF